MFREIAHDCFIAEGGTDDFDSLTDEQLKAIAADFLRRLADDSWALHLIVTDARKIREELNS